MSAYTDKIQKLYVAYFNRPADFSGLAFWENAVANAKDPNAMLDTISAQFATSAEYKATFAGMDEAHIVNQVYLNLFGRPANDLQGLTFWTQRLMNHDVTIDNVVTKIAEGAQNEDKVALNNKIAAAKAFTAALDTAEKALAYSGEQAAGVAKQWLSTIGDDASLKLGTDKAALDAVIQDVIEHGPQPVGQTFNLTAGLDILVGTSGNDVFNAYAINTVTGVDAKNMNSFDSIDGGAGKDTLNLQVNAGFNALADLGTVKNVEIINISGNTVAVDASKFVGATAINQLGTGSTINNLAAGTTAGFTGTTGSDVTVNAAGASAAVSFNNVDENAVLFVGGAKLASVKVSGTRADINGDDDIAALALDVTTGKDVLALTIDSAIAAEVTLNETTGTTKHLASVDASASAGAITLDATGLTALATVKTGAGADTVTINTTTAAATSTAAAINASVSTGAGNDVIFVNTIGDGLTSVDAGAGNDKITVTKVVNGRLNIQAGDGNDTVTIAGDALETTDVINGGAGTDIIAVAGKAARVADDYIVFNKLITGFETIKFTGATAEGALDASQLAANYTTIDLNAGGVVTAVGSQAIIANGAVTAAAAGYALSATNVSTYAGTLNVTEKAAGTVTAKADVVNLAITGLAASLNGDVQTATINVNNKLNAAGDADVLGSVSVTTTGTAGAANLSGLKSLTLAGSGAATVTNNGGKLVSVDASALGGTLVDGKATAGLTYVSTNAAAESIKLGSGIDKITLSNSVYGKVDSVTGLHLVLTSDKSALDGSSDVLKVTGVGAATGGVTKFVTTQTDIDFALKDAAAGHTAIGAAVVFTLGGDTYVYQDNGTAGSVDSADVLVKIVGGVELDALIKSLG